VEGVILRNNNGSQFIANKLRTALKEMGIDQEFTHIDSPQENGFIESLHSQLQRAVIDRYIFDSICEAEWIIARYYDFYNSQQLHGGIGYKTPDQIWDENMISIPYKTTHQKQPESNEKTIEKRLYSNNQFVQEIRGRYIKLSSFKRGWYIRQVVRLSICTYITQTAPYINT
jgi:hypothetical protein